MARWPMSTGALVWPTSIALGINDIAIGGNFCKGTLYIGATTLTGVSCTVQNVLRTGFLVRMRNDGSTYLAVHSLGTYGWTDAVGRASDDRVFATGKFQSALRLDAQTVLVVGADDAYVLAMAP